MSSDPQNPQASSTPGAEALREAARLEAARIYGQLQREHRQGDEAPVVAEVHDLAAERQRRRWTA